jgi:hypothetical protein
LLEILKEPRFRVVLFHVTFPNHDSRVVPCHCTAVRELSMPETHDFSYIQSILMSETILQAKDDSDVSQREEKLVHASLYMMLVLLQNLNKSLTL